MDGDGGACFVDAGTAVVAGGGGTVDGLSVTVGTGILVVTGGIIFVVFVVIDVGTILTNRSDAGLNLSGSWQQGHSATYNTPSRI